MSYLSQLGDLMNYVEALSSQSQDLSNQANSGIIPSSSSIQAIVQMAQDLSNQANQLSATGIQSTTIPPFDATTRSIDDYSIKSLYSGSTDQEECVICMAHFQNREEIRRLGCFHFYHVKCIDNWLKTKEECPVCRFDIFKET